MVARLKPQPDTRTVHHVPQPASNRFVDIDTILFFFGQLREKSAAKRAAAKAEQGVRKQFKNAGVSLNVYDVVVNLSELDDPDAIQKWLDEFLHIASAFQTVPVGTQFNIFEGAGSAVDANEKAFKTGHMRGVSGQQPDTQAYPENTPLGQEHMRGWYEGQEVLKQRFMDMNAAAQQEEAEKKAAAEEKAKKKAEREAKANGAETPKTADGETVQ